MRFVRPAFLIGWFLVTVALRAQSIPILQQPFPDQALAPGGAAVTIDIRNYIVVPTVTGTQFAQFDTVLGKFNVELRDDAAPKHVANFLSYVQADAYSNSFFHRSGFDVTETSPSILQGGGYRLPLVTVIPKLAPVPLEYNLPNSRGTLAAARTSDPNSATSEWYFNVRDNSAALGPVTANGASSPGYTVFGRVIGSGMTVVDAIAALPRVTIQGQDVFGNLPVRNFSGGAVDESNLVIVNSIRKATLFPTGGGPSVVELATDNSAPGVVNLVLSGSTLTMSPVSPGTANITIRATDSNGNTTTGTFKVTVAGTAPVFSFQPKSQSVATGTTAVFNAPSVGAASYVWQHDGKDIPGATTDTLVISNATAADQGYYVAYASNAFDRRVSEAALLSVDNYSATAVGRLVNLSILTSAGSGAKVLTMGAVVGPGGLTNTLPLVVRAVGPTLAQAPFNVTGVLADPVMTFFAQGNSAPIDANDNWGGSAALSTAFAAVAAFALPANSLDSAIVRSTPGVSAGGYTVQVTGKGSATGTVLAEIYDASGTTRDANSPRLINLSTLAQIDAGKDLTVGFVLGGQSSRTVLVRGVGPSLAAFGVSGLMEDPKLQLFNNSNGQLIAENDNWAGNLAISGAGADVAAFPLTSGFSKDAALLITLPPGPYSARVSGAGGAGGTAIVEVYEIP